MSPAVRRNLVDMVVGVDRGNSFSHAERSSMKFTGRGASVTKAVLGNEMI
jgi:hypothetical protein